VRFSGVDLGLKGANNVKGDIYYDLASLSQAHEAPHCRSIWGVVSMHHPKRGLIAHFLFLGSSVVG
jgi:hypothetical protein